MRALFVLSLLSLAACGGTGSTATVPTRYNFGIVDGANQRSVAGTAALAKPVTAMLTRDPQGHYASRVFDWFAPAIAYAQSLTVPGDPVPNKLVCGEETGVGEPKIVPLCAFTLADGKAANSVQGGTKAGTYTMRFTAQVTTQMPVKDSTTVTVEAGALAKNNLTGLTQFGLSPLAFDNGTSAYLQDAFGNRIAYRLEVTGPAHVAGDIFGDLSARTVVADPAGLCTDNCSGTFRPEEWGKVSVVTKDGPIATADLHVSYANPGWTIQLGQF